MTEVVQTPVDKEVEVIEEEPEQGATFQHFIATSELDKYTIPEGMEPNDYIFAQNGIFRYRKNIVCQALYPISEGLTEGLSMVEPWCLPLLPKMSYPFLEEALNFCRYGVEKGHGEVMLLLTIDKDNKWGWHAPEKQSCSQANVQYTRSLADEFDALGSIGTQVVGTMHSHCNMGGFFSGTDDRDDKFGFDGIHMVFGTVSRPVPQMEWSITLGGVRYVAGKHFPKDLVLEENPITPVGVPKAWVDTIAPKTTYNSTTAGSQYGTHYPRSNVDSTVPGTHRTQGPNNTNVNGASARTGFTPAGNVKPEEIPALFSDLPGWDQTSLVYKFAILTEALPDVENIRKDGEQCWERIQEKIFSGALKHPVSLEPIVHWFEEKFNIFEDLADSLQYISSQSPYWDRSHELRKFYADLMDLPHLWDIKLTGHSFYSACRTKIMEGGFLDENVLRQITGWLEERYELLQDLFDNLTEDMLTDREKAEIEADLAIAEVDHKLLTEGEDTDQHSNSSAWAAACADKGAEADPDTPPSDYGSGEEVGREPNFWTEEELNAHIARAEMEADEKDAAREIQELAEEAEQAKVDALRLSPRHDSTQFWGRV